MLCYVAENAQIMFLHRPEELSLDKSIYS